MKSITIGSWDGEEKVISVSDNATVSDVLSQAGITIANTQSVTTFSNAENVSLTSPVVDGESYFLTGNHQSG